jgi:glycerophosphoryl diester phosphodiesterase
MTQTPAFYFGPKPLVQGTGLPLVLGHRGARYAALENTMRAFELARTEGAVGTELDVQTSRDGELFVVHDVNLKRITDGRISTRVVDMSAAELDAVRLPGELPIPRLGQVLDWASHHSLYLNIELKTAGTLTDRVAESVARMLTERATPPDTVVVSSFRPLLLRRFHRAAPHYPSGLLIDRHRGCLAKRKWLDALGCSAVHPHAELLLAKPALFEKLGAPINTWTVNDPDRARRLAELGAHAIITDRPGEIVRALSALGSAG